MFVVTHLFVDQFFNFQISFSNVEWYLGAEIMIPGVPPLVRERIIGRGKNGEMT